MIRYETKAATVRTVSAIALLALISACGQSTGDRALSGAGIGAGVGAATAAVTGGSVGTGALIGAGVGAAGGALTNERDVNFGKPIWRR